KESKNRVITNELRQRFLQSLGTLRRKSAKVVRYDFEPTDFFTISTEIRPQESVSASSIKGGGAKTYFYTEKTKETLSDEYVDFFDDATEEGIGYKIIEIKNHYDFKTPLNAVIADHENEKKFIKQLTSDNNVSHIDAWIKSTTTNFYSIDYYWRKGEHPKKGQFNPDFFIKIGDLISVIEIKDDSEISEPSPENKKKREYALKHFKLLDEEMKRKKLNTRYNFNFLTPKDFSNYFQSIRNDEIKDGFVSSLDVELDK
ncbi:MAG: restriction endonuclease subunit R, partial [Patescibacteria group bacterium]|nr:restriction endonuclease subunit R [Patescibacteria group bacterium]